MAFLKLTSSLLLATCLHQGHASSGLTKRTLPSPTGEEFGAYCLDGSMPTFDIRLAGATSTNSNKWILYLEGGGWCNGATEEDTIEACKGRARFDTFSEYVRAKRSREDEQ